MAQFEFMFKEYRMPVEVKGLFVPQYGYLQAWGETVPANGSTGYAHGCQFTHLDGTTTDALTVNEGDKDSSNFVART